MAAATSSRRGSLSPKASREIGWRAIVQASTPAATVALMASVTSAPECGGAWGILTILLHRAPQLAEAKLRKFTAKVAGTYRGPTFAPNFRVPNPARLQDLLVGSATAKSLRRSA
jgi:hypothetical protein